MPNVPSLRIHPTAVISPEAELAEDVQVGPYVIIEGPVRIGSGCVIKPYVHLCGPLVMGRNNTIFSGAVLGERPQHMKYKDEPTRLEIGDNNIFREHVTIHRGTPHSWATRIGNANFFMAHSHIGHDCQVGNNCIFTNGALVAGHCVIADNVILSGNSAVHQFVRVGRLALISGLSATTKDLPPFMIIQGINKIQGLNVIGMRRSGMSHERIDAARRAFHLIYRNGHILSKALELVEKELGQVDVVQELLTFIRQGGRGISLGNERERGTAA